MSIYHFGLDKKKIYGRTGFKYVLVRILVAEVEVGVVVVDMFNRKRKDNNMNLGQIYVIWSSTQ